MTRQVLAEPDEDLDPKVWARLADGTPLVTATHQGKGLIVLFHVTADTSWSNLPISGLFVGMLNRVVSLGLNAGVGANPVAADANAAAPRRPPVKTLDGFGVLGAPPATAEPIGADFDTSADPRHPPGLYGAGEALTAVNTLKSGEVLTPAAFGALGVQRDGLAVEAADTARALALAARASRLSHRWRRDARARAAARKGAWRPAAVAILAMFVDPRGRCGIRRYAANGDPSWQPALDTSLAYIVTGDPSVDEATKAGMERLTFEIVRRTSAELADPVALDPSKDELAFYPMIYWPVAANRPQPSAGTAARIAAYMRNGGTIVFDTRDALTARDGGPPTPEALWLRTLLDGVDIPQLEPLPRDHVATKTFYLIDNFVGRTDSGLTWIEALPPPDPNDPVKRPARAGDSVSPIVLVSNDLAAAWAADLAGQPLYPLVPGGPRQREMAIRGGVNLVMYTLTGNYKADQVHAKDLIERLSH